MNKLIVILLLLLMSLSSSAQLSNVSVCGIKMGTDRETAKSMLEKRFGYLSVKESNGNIEVFDGVVGGVPYDYMKFFFAWVNGQSRFNGSYFSKIYELNEQKDALDARDLIRRVYEQKYTIYERNNDDGFKEYNFGYGDDVYGKITVNKSPGKDKKIRLYVDVYYFGPYDESDDI